LFRGVDEAPGKAHLASRTVVTELSDLLTDALRAEIGDSRFELWFEGNTNLALDRDGVRVEVPNRYFREWFEVEFGAEIKSAAAKAVGKKVPVRFSIADGVRDVEPPAETPTELPAKTVARKRPAAAKPIGPVKVIDAPAAKVAPTPTKAVPANVPEPPRRPSRYSLTSFVVGTPNRVAYAAASALVENPAASASPIYIYGGIGVGKSHLLRGVEEGLRRRAGIKIACYNCEEFANEFIEAYKANKLPAFRRRIRSLDLLLIDDVQFLAGKRATQEELVHAMEAIQHRGGKVILTGDAHPRRLAKIGEDLRSRFLAGMAAKLDPPTREMRRQLVVVKAAERGLKLGVDVVAFIADQVRTGVRELEGATTYLSHALKHSVDPLSVAETKVLLADHLRHSDSTLELPAALAKALDVFQVTKARLQDRSRAKCVSEPRALIIYLLRRFTGAAYSEIGRAIGGFNHSTVLAAEKRVRDKLLKDESVLIGDRRWKLQDALDAFEREVGRPD
jgi:chromosomal replication initiator protein